MSMAVFAVLAPLPLLDEILGRFYFIYLCKESTVQISPTARGRTVYSESGGYTLIKRFGFRARRLTSNWRDATTDELVLSYDSFQPKGGLFSRAITEGGAPMTYGSRCHESQVERLMSELQLIFVPQTSLDRFKWMKKDYN